MPLGKLFGGRSSKNVQKEVTAPVIVEPPKPLYQPRKSWTTPGNREASVDMQPPKGSSLPSEGFDIRNWNGRGFPSRDSMDSATSRASVEGRVSS